ncbi:uncharacterized protein LOC105664952 [Ceratitis capitata]|uniref:(Mediterranean fruit fly) hypothetical protein n=1 Tax=Ceratitis capitata TaxID=7213 RepID=W8CB92_CERCA|nr:uncharacterized protein LOC105664952 [Ceratitis capitata]CAD6996127.1 unnamed protein product [Ceratitis capitata]
MESAIFEDCRKLIDLFVTSGNHTFASFCKQWKALQFQQIYYAQTTHIEVIQTTAAIMNCARHEICDSEVNIKNGDLTVDKEVKNTTAQHFTDEVMRRRIGYLFLLYAIYFKQPTEGFVKIETTLNTWHILKTFIDSLPPSIDMDDVRYVFWRLLQADAFRFTALNYCVGLEDLVDYEKLNDRENTSFQYNNSGKGLEQQLHDFSAIKRILPALSVLEDGYNEMKEMLVNTNTNGLHKQSLPASTIFKSIEQCFQNIQSIVDDSESGSKANSLLLESSKRHLKRKGFSNNYGEKQDNSKVDNENNSRKHKSLRRMSARTVFTDKLPSDMLEDLEEQRSIGSDDHLDDHIEPTYDRGVLQESVAEIAGVNLTDSQEETDGTAEYLTENCEVQEVIERQMNDLLEIELTEEFVSIPKDKEINNIIKI